MSTLRILFFFFLYNTINSAQNRHLKQLLAQYFKITVTASKLNSLTIWLHVHYCWTYGRLPTLHKEPRSVRSYTAGWTTATPCSLASLSVSWRGCSLS